MTTWTVGQPCIVTRDRNVRTSTIVKVCRRYVHVSNEAGRVDEFDGHTGRLRGEYPNWAHLYTVEAYATEQKKSAAETALRGLLDRWRPTTFTDEQLDELIAVIERMPK